MKKEYFLVKYKLYGSNSYKHSCGNFQKQEHAMDRVEELKKDKSISEIVVHKRKGMNSVKIYSCDGGFESVYLNRSVV
jgi:hypothetical protein